MDARKEFSESLIDSCEDWTLVELSRVDRKVYHIRHKGEFVYMANSLTLADIRFEDFCNADYYAGLQKTVNRKLV